MNIKKNVKKKLTLPMQNEGIGYLRIQNLPWSTFQLPLEAGSRPQRFTFRYFGSRANCDPQQKYASSWANIQQKA